MSSRPSVIRIDDLGLTKLIGRPLLSKESIVVHTPLGTAILRLLLGVADHTLEFDTLVRYVSQDQRLINEVGGATALYRINLICQKLAGLGFVQLS
jgi:hypothetical protein